MACLEEVFRNFEWDMEIKIHSECVVVVDELNYQQYPVI